MIRFRKGYSVSVPCLPLEDRSHVAILVGPLARFYAGDYNARRWKGKRVDPNTHREEVPPKL
jgi:hypothetical protein